MESGKTVLFLKSTSSSSLNNGVMTDLHSLKRPLSLRFTKKNSLHPFEDSSSLEFFSGKNDASLMCFSSHSKKRPHNLTFVRTFDAKVLDMLECMIDAESARLMNQFGSSKARVGTKPMLSFSGPMFEDAGEASARFRLAKSLFMDFFRGDEVNQVDVEGLQTIISFVGSDTVIPGAASRQVVHMRVWKVATKRSGQKMPRVELEEMGPRVDFRLGRMQQADANVLKEALKRSKQSEAKLKKNIETDLMGDKLGRIHMMKQDLNDLQTRKMKGLKRGRDELRKGHDAGEDAEANDDDGDEHGKEGDDDDDDDEEEDSISFIDDGDSDQDQDRGSVSDKMDRDDKALASKRQRLQ